MGKAKILVVEDEALTARDLQLQLIQMGYDVPCIALSGEDAIKKAGEINPDLLLMDIKLAGEMDGIEAAKQIRLINMTPVIYLSAYMDKMVSERAKDTEPFGYLTKPFSEYDLRNTIEMALYKHGVEKKLRREKEFTDAAIDAQIDTFFVFDPMTKKAIRWNKQFREITGYSDEEIAALKAPHSYLTQEDLEKAADVTKEIMDKGQTKVRLSLICKDGRKVPTEYSASVIRGEDNNIKYIISIGRDIAERIRFEDEIRNNKIRMENAQRVGHLGFWDWNIETDTLYWSDETYRIYGFKPQEFVPTFEIFKGILFPDDLEYVLNKVDAALKDIEPYNVDFRYIYPDGKIGWIHSEGEVSLNEKGESVRFFGTQIDITARRKALEFIQNQRDLGIALSDAKDLKEALTLLLDLAVLIDDMDSGGIYLVDQVSGDLNLVCDKGLIKDFVSKIGHYDKDTENSRLAMNGKPVYVNYSMLPISKTETENKEGLLSIAVIPILHHGRVIACMNIASHITDEINLNTRNALETIASQVGSIIARLVVEESLKKAKEEIEAWSRELEKRVNMKTEELERSQTELIQSEKLSAMGQMAGGLAHELNSPLAGLLPMLERFKDISEEGTREHKEFSLMLRACEHMAIVVRDFSSFSRESKGLAYGLDLNEVIEDTLSFSIGRFKQKSIEVVTEYKDDLPKIIGVKTELQQVVLNIITNAFDAMAEAGKFIIRTGTSGDNVFMEFIDNGAGIEKDKLDKIFDPFYTTKRPGKGTGLGLSISYKIVKKHEGEILVESESGKGTKFVIYLPANRINYT